MSLPAHVDVPSRPQWAPTLVPVPTPAPPADAPPEQQDHPRGDWPRTELADLPDLRTGKAVIDRWVDELLAADALDEATTDVFERLIDDWADRFRRRLLQDSLDRAAHADLLQAEARGEAARALLGRRRAEREYAVALAALEAARQAPQARTDEIGTSAEGRPDPAGPPDAVGPPEAIGAADQPATASGVEDWPEQGVA